MQPKSPSSKPALPTPLPSLNVRLLSLREQLDRLKQRQLFVRLLLGAMLIGLIVSLTACAPLSRHTQPPGSQRVQLPSPPALTTPIPSQSYSSTAADDISTWQERLMVTPMTSRP